MFRLKKHNGKFLAVLMSQNSKELSVKSFTVKPSAIKNIQSMLKVLNSKAVVMQDDTLQSGSVVYVVYPNKIKQSGMKPIRILPSKSKYAKKTKRRTLKRSKK